jgi:hypothetical protein
MTLADVQNKLLGRTCEHGCEGLQKVCRRSNQDLQHHNNINSNVLDVHAEGAVGFTHAYAHVHAHTHTRARTQGRLGKPSAPSAPSAITTLHHCICRDCRHAPLARQVSGWTGERSVTEGCGAGLQAVAGLHWCAWYVGPEVETDVVVFA